MRNARASYGSFVGGAIFAALAVIAASHSARVEAAPGDRIGRLPFAVSSSPSDSFDDFPTDIATDVNGRFLVVWQRFAEELFDENDVMARFFTAAGVPLGAEIQLVSGAADGLRHDNAQVAWAADGTFVVVWAQFDFSVQGMTSRERVNEIRGQRYDANFAPLSAPFIVSSGDSSQFLGVADVVMAADGRFAVAWGLSDFPEQTSHVSLYDADGRPRGAPFEVTADSFSPRIAVRANGEFTVAWSERPAEHQSNVRLRRFDADGAPLGGIEDVATYGFAEGEGPIRLAMNASGQLVVAYLNGDTRVAMRRYDAAGGSLGAEVLVAEGALGHFDLVGNAAGDFVFAWLQGVGPLGELMLHTRLYRASGTAVTAIQAYSFREISKIGLEVPTLGFGPNNFLAVFPFRRPPSAHDSYGQPFAGARDTRPSCARFIATRNGTPGADTLNGSAAHDIINAHGGNDTVYGWGGLDVICGAGGSDVLYGGSGNDQLVGGPGDDVLDGGTGNGDYCNGEGHTNADTAVSCEVTRNIP